MDLVDTLVDKALRRELPTKDEALAVLHTEDEWLMDGSAADPLVRRR